MITGSEDSMEKKLVEFENNVITEVMDEEENDNTNGGKKQHVVYLHILHTQLFLADKCRKWEASETNKEQLGKKSKKTDANKENQQPSGNKRQRCIKIKLKTQPKKKLKGWIITKHDTVYNNDLYLLATGSLIKVVPHSITEIEDTPSVILEEPGEK